MWLSVRNCSAAVIDIRSTGAVAGENSVQAAQQNAKAILAAFARANAGDTVLVPAVGDKDVGNTANWFYAQGGIYVDNLVNVTFELQGVLAMDDHWKVWPVQESLKRVYNFVQFNNCTQLTINGGGVVQGQGKVWWEEDILGHLPYNRPKMLYVFRSTHIQIHDLLLHDSPAYHVRLDDVDTAEVWNVHIRVDRKAKESARALRKGRVGAIELEDLNTDGIDPSGKNVYVHDCTIVNDDDSIAVKPCSGDCVNSKCSENMVFERLTLQGVGASIGSVPPVPAVNCVRNITFRDINMPKTAKGIYIKSNPTCDGSNSGIIENIVYENVTITEPRWWAIWIGPQQQHEPHEALGRKCALDYPISKHCPTQGCVTFANIVLKDVFVDRPWLSPGVIKGNSTHPMTGVVFDNVVVREAGELPFRGQYECEYAQLEVKGETYPVPRCNNGGKNRIDF